MVSQGNPPERITAPEEEESGSASDDEQDPVEANLALASALRHEQDWNLPIYALRKPNSVPKELGC